MCTSLPFDICQFTENNFYKSLGNSYVDPVEIASYQRPSYLYGYLKHLNAQTIFIEKDYIDGDYIEDLLHFMLDVLGNIAAFASGSISLKDLLKQRIS
jgi:hypothetical protein